MLDNIKLPNGVTMSWDDFANLPQDKQTSIAQSINQEKEKYWEVNEQEASLPTRKELLPRIRAAAERNAFKEEDLLAFIKLMHDIFFPPQPMPALKPGEILPGKAKRNYVNSPFTKLSKAVITPAGDFPSMAEAGRFYGVEGSRIRAWIKGGKSGFDYKSE